MSEQFVRTELLLGREAMEILRNSRVAVFGIGGVGGYTVEALTRSGVGAIDLIDNDTVCLSNLNRQIIATHRTIGRYKVDVMKERILEINPEALVETHRCFYLPETRDAFDFAQYSYVVDAVDTVTAKLQLVQEAQRAGVPIISSMGAGNKLDPTRFEVADIYETSVCPLAKVMRRELKKRGVEHLKVVYSREEPVQQHILVGRNHFQEEPEHPEYMSGEPYTGAEISDILHEKEKISDELHTEAEIPGRLHAEEKISGELHIEAEIPGGPHAEEKISGGLHTEKGTPHARRATPGSTAFVPSVAGLIIAGEVIRDLVKLHA